MVETQEQPKIVYVPDGAAQERDKYAEVWSMRDYREADSPGMENVERFMKVLEPAVGSVIIDIGCGAGIAGLAFRKLNMQTWWLDITSAGLHPNVNRARFYEQPLWQEIGGAGNSACRFDYGFCCDVLEHIPTEYTMLCLRRIVDACDIAWIQLANKQDAFGPALIGEPLHLTVMPYSWWLIRVASICNIHDARDLCGQSLFVVSRK